MSQGTAHETNAGGPTRHGRWAMILVVVAGLQGAAGVALAAVAAHVAPTPALATAAQILILHATAAVAITAAASLAARPRAMLAVATLMLAGAALFSGDVALLHLAGRRLFPFAAPTGGSTMILSWLGLAGVAAHALLRLRRA